MKKSLTILTAAAAAFALTFALVGCSSGTSGSTSGSASAEAASSASAEATESAEASEAESSEGAESEVGIPNPWSDVDSAEAAAEGAGIDSFVLPEGAEINLGKVEFGVYRCMEGLAEAIDDFPAVQMTVRKGTKALAQGDNADDVSGDYSNYKYTWTQDVNGLEITCAGNREGDATKTIWTSGDYCYSINVLGLGGDTDFGLSADDLNTLVSAMQ